MSHHSAESMEYVAFRKGRNAFRNDDDYRRALRGESLEYELAGEDFEEDLGNEDIDGDESEADTSDEDLDDEPITCGIFYGEHYHDFYDFLNDLLALRTKLSFREANRLFDWLYAHKFASRCPYESIKLLLERTSLTLHLTDKSKTTGTDLKCSIEKDRLDGVGTRTVRDECSFEDFLDLIDWMLEKSKHPFDKLLKVIADGLDAVSGTTKLQWQNSISDFFRSYPDDNYTNLTLTSGEDAQSKTKLRFIRYRNPMSGIDQTWVMNPETDNDKPKVDFGCPTKLLYWLYLRRKFA